MGTHKHWWKFSGIVTEGTRLGLSHSYCKCGGERYLPATKAELKRHDPRGEIAKKMKEEGYGPRLEAAKSRRRGTR